MDGDPEADPLVVCTNKQLRNKIYYELQQARRGGEDQQFRTNDEGRTAYHREDSPGMAFLEISNRIDRVKLADWRLLKSARRLRAAGDERTIAQIKSDLALDLIIGDTVAPAPPKFARPIINLTVPAQTLMGIADLPGVLAGGHVVPPSLARMIAHQPGSTWHRMLTDEAGHMVELSTRSYQPTGAIWQHVVAEHHTCFRPCGEASSTEGDLDHREAWPMGPTDTTNLWPGCRTDHRTKHAPGFAVEQAADGSYVLRTAAGLRHRIERTEQPDSDDFYTPDLEATDGFQFSATEFVNAVEYLRELDHDRRPVPDVEYWEIGFEEALSPAAQAALDCWSQS